MQQDDWYPVWWFNFQIGDIQSACYDMLHFPSLEY